MGSINLISYNVITHLMAEIFETKIRKIGNSLGVIIPSDLIEELGYHNGDTVKVAIPPSGLKKRNDLLKQLAGQFKGKSPFVRENEDRF